MSRAGPRWRPGQERPALLHPSYRQSPGTSPHTGEDAAAEADNSGGSVWKWQISVSILHIERELDKEMV